MTTATPPLKILFVTPECAPWVKTGGLGDVSQALPRALADLGHDIAVLMPGYASLRPLMDTGQVVAHLLPYGDWPTAQLVQVPLPGLELGQARLLLLDCPALYDLPGGPYQNPQGQDHAHNAQRFGLLGWAAAVLGSDASPLPWRADIVHANDWPTALAPVYLHELPAPAASIMTIHNLAFQGIFPLSCAAGLRLPQRLLTMQGLEYWGQLSFLKGGLTHADAISTVSPTYASEIQSEALGFGLHGVLRERAHQLVGILNGIDTRTWNPATDPLIAQTFDHDSLVVGKRANKAALQTRCGLLVSSDTPLFGVVSRLTEQKGIDLLVELIPWLVAQGAQLAVLGQGDPLLEARLREAAQAHPGRVSAIIGFNEALAHTVEAGADSFLMPSRFEPCGLNQMYSLAYGTLPVVRATGGLADSVVDELADPSQSTGFVFRTATVDDLQEALRRALACFHDAPRWQEMQRRAMRQRFDWDSSARSYDALYRETARRLAPVVLGGTPP